MQHITRTFGLAALVLAAGAAQAGTTFTSLSVTANVSANCTTVSASPIVINVAQGAGGSNTSTVAATCGSGTAYTSYFEAGANSTVAQRRLISGANLLNYTLKDTNCAGAAVGTTGAGYAVAAAFTGSGLAGTGTGAATNQTVAACVVGADTILAPAGAYTDSVAVVVEF